eukprot:CAMPEP_0174258158 /NCGR_PEP_ID=MMETSP0439-20130205/7210_1 /TAXON_ID=0 /ORGANISM="Stereomyxa ramosa, Strain Chinc5" /LENGTH=99 /DNA_ID=CAMNT_0015341565 /DNA_START=936 /DNA_END=1231 /DNA_ORIENTATION=+
MKEYDKKHLNYVLVLKEFLSSRGVTLRTNIDGTVYGNVSRFFNHSHDPNLIFVLVRVDSFIPRVAFFAKRDIEEGEELRFDYGESRGGEENKRKECKCG